MHILNALEEVHYALEEAEWLASDFESAVCPRAEHLGYGLFMHSLFVLGKALLWLLLIDALRPVYKRVVSFDVSAILYYRIFSLRCGSDQRVVLCLCEQTDVSESVYDLMVEDAPQLRQPLLFCKANVIDAHGKGNQLFAGIVLTFYNQTRRCLYDLWIDGQININANQLLQVLSQLPAKLLVLCLVFLCLLNNRRKP